MNQQFKYIIKLPPINKLRSNSKIIDPYTKLYKYIVKEVYPNWKLFYEEDDSGFPKIPDKRLNVSAVWVTFKDDRKLYSLVEEWCEMVRGKNNNGMASYYYLDLGPATLDKHDSKHKPGYLYIREDLLINRE
jgi:hypothetical protein